MMRRGGTMSVSAETETTPSRPGPAAHAARHPKSFVLSVIAGGCDFAEASFHILTTEGVLGRDTPGKE